MDRTQNVERKLKHLFDGSDLNVYESDVLNLGVGAPGPDLLENCCRIFQIATEHRMRYEKETNSSLLFQYGPADGTFESRSSIAKYLSKMYDNEVKSEDLIITSGATQGLHVILSTLIDLEGYIFVDEVTYFIALNCISQFTTLHIIPVRINEDGVDLEYLSSLLQEKQFKSTTKEFWGLYYTIPTYHNPTGVLFSDAVCKGLIKLARNFDILIACDDVYNILHYEETKPPKRLFAFDNVSDDDYRGNVISNGSFSKIISPGIRLGWMEVPAHCKTVIDKCGISQSGGCFNNYTSGIIASLFELNLAQTHINLVLLAYKERMLATCKVLQENLPKDCHMILPRGGYFIWIRLPEHVSAADFLKFSMAEDKICFLPGTKFSYENKSANCIRITIAFHNKEKLIDGAKRLCTTMNKYLKQ